MLKLAKQVRAAKDGPDRDQVKKRLENEYDLTEDDWATIDHIVEYRQFSVLSYWGSEIDGKYIGDFSPIMVMQEDRKDEVEEDYRAVMRRFKGAMKKLRPQVK